MSSAVALKRYTHERVDLSAAAYPLGERPFEHMDLTKDEKEALKVIAEHTQKLRAEIMVALQSNSMESIGSLGSMMQSLSTLMATYGKYISSQNINVQHIDAQPKNIRTIMAELREMLATSSDAKSNPHLKAIAAQLEQVKPGSNVMRHVVARQNGVTVTSSMAGPAIAGRSASVTATTNTGRPAASTATANGNTAPANATVAAKAGKIATNIVGVTAAAATQLAAVVGPVAATTNPTALAPVAAETVRTTVAAVAAKMEAQQTETTKAEVRTNNVINLRRAAEVRDDKIQSAEVADKARKADVRFDDNRRTDADTSSKSIWKYTELRQNKSDNFVAFVEKRVEVTSEKQAQATELKKVETVQQKKTETEIIPITSEPEKKIIIGAKAVAESNVNTVDENTKAKRGNNSGIKSEYKNAAKQGCGVACGGNCAACMRPTKIDMAAASALIADL